MENSIWQDSCYYIEVTAPYSETDVKAVYSLVNKETGVREGEYNFLPQAIQYAKDLTDALDKLKEIPQKESNTLELVTH